MNPKDVRLVFMGSPEFAVPPLRALAAAGYQVVAAVTQPDKPAGRGGALSEPAVKAAAAALGVPVLQPGRLKDPSAVEALEGLAPDLFVVAAYGKILPQAVLDIPKRGSVNVHASLLPRWRGASPITAAILAGDVETGVSIMEMALAMDAGPVIAKASTPIGGEDTTGTLEPRLAELGARTLIGVLPGWYDRQITPEAQDEAHVTLCRLVSKADGHLRASMTVDEASRAVRAYNPWPGAYVLYRGERLAIWAAHVLAGACEGRSPGTCAVVGKSPAVVFRTASGGTAALALDLVQRPGGKRLSGEQFLNGERGLLAPEVGLA